MDTNCVLSVANSWRSKPPSFCWTSTYCPRCEASAGNAILRPFTGEVRYIDVYEMSQEISENQRGQRNSWLSLRETGNSSCSDCVLTGLKVLTLIVLMSYIYRDPCKARNFNVLYIWTHVWQRWKSPLYICCTMSQYWMNYECSPVSYLCVNTTGNVSFLPHKLLFVSQIGRASCRERVFQPV
jgi:hypothetical protein